MVIQMYMLKCKDEGIINSKYRVVSTVKGEEME